MKLTNEERQKIVTGIKTRNMCPNCGQSGVDMLDAKFHLVSLDEANNTVLSDRMSAFPVVATSCITCGYISLFNANHLGIG